MTPLVSEMPTAAEPGLVPEQGRYEFVDGQLREKPPMGAKANRVATLLVSLLNVYALARKLGPVFSQECGYQIFPDQPKKVRKPDFSFIPRGRLPGDKLPDGNLTVAPDLVGEVVSPNDLAEDIEARVDDYLPAGVKQVWVLHPNRKTVYVYRHDGSARRLTVADELSGETVLPDFTCRVAELFAEV